MNFLLKILHDTLYFSGPILFCTLGGLLAYKAGVVNIGLEGMMLFGGFIATLIIFLTQSWWLGLLAAVILAILLGLLYSFFGITLKGNFIITGFAINLLAVAVGRYTLALMNRIDINIIGVPGILNPSIRLWLIHDIPVLGSIISDHPLFTYVSLAMIGFIHLVMYHTKFGVYVRVVGENEEAARSVGINVNTVKYAAIIAGAILCAFAGINVAVEQLASYTPAITAGTGFIAIAAFYCGNGSPIKSSLYAVLFGVAKALSINLSIRIGSIATLLEIIPYATIVVVLTSIALIRRKKSLVRGLEHD